jgi:chromosome segregation ATPase
MGKSETTCGFCGVSYLVFSEVKELEKRLKTTEEKLKTFTGKASAHDELEGQVKRLVSAAQKQQDSLNEMEKEEQRKKGLLDEATAATQLTEELNKTLVQELSQEKDKSTARSRALSTELPKSRQCTLDARSDLQAIRGEINGAQADIQTIAAKISARVEQASADMQRVQVAEQESGKGLEAERARVSELEVAVEDLKAKLEAASAEHKETIESHHNDRQETEGGLSSALEGTRVEMERLGVALREEKERAVEAATKSDEDAKAKAAQAAAALRLEEQKQEQTSAELTATREALREKGCECAQAQERLDSIRGDLSNGAQNEMQLGKQLTELKHKLNESQLGKRTADEELATLRQEMERGKGTHASDLDKLEERNKEVVLRHHQDHVQEIRRKDQEIQDLEGQLALLKQLSEAHKASGEAEGEARRREGAKQEELEAEVRRLQSKGKELGGAIQVEVEKGYATMQQLEEAKEELGRVANRLKGSENMSQLASARAAEMGQEMEQLQRNKVEMAQQLSVLRNQLRSKDAALEEDSGGSAAAEQAMEGMVRMEKTLGNLTGLIRQKDGEIGRLQAIVHRECMERMRMLEEINDLRANGGVSSSAGAGNDGEYAGVAMVKPGDVTALPPIAPSNQMTHDSGSMSGRGRGGGDGSSWAAGRGRSGGGKRGRRKFK